MPHTNPPEEIILGPWPLGMNNRQPDYALPNGTVRNAVNADFDQVGYARRRRGYSRVYAGASAHSGFSCPAGEFFAEAGTLKRLNADNTATVMRQGLNGGQIAYEYFDGVVYFSDGAATGKIVSGAAVPWGMDAPPAPKLMALSGSYGQGTYVAALTAVDAGGRESGASEVATLLVGEGAGIKFYDLPSTTALRLYLSAPDGTTMYFVAEVPAGTTSHTLLAGRYDNGRPLDSQFISRPPAGSIIRHHKGRMYIAAGSTLWYTEPYALDRVYLSRNFFQFPQSLSVVEPTDAGMWVVADKTYFYRGDGPETFKQETKLGYGAVLGTAVRVPNTTDVMWYSSRGVIVGTENGEANNRQEVNVAAESGTSGATLVRDKDGVQQFIASIKDPVVSPLVAQSFFSAEVIRKAAP